MWLSLLPYLVTGKNIYVYPKSGSFWYGRVVFLWFDHFVLEVSNSKVVIIAFDTIDDIREHSNSGSVWILDKIYNDESAEEHNCGH